MNLNLGNVTEAEDRVVLPAEHARAPGFLQRPARRLDAAALDLVGDAVRVHRQADVDRGDEARHAQLAPGLDFRDHRAVGADVLVPGEADAAATPFSFPEG